MRPNWVIGVITTSSFSFFASLSLIYIPGIMKHGNYGIRLYMAPLSPLGHHTIPIFVPSGSTSVPFSSFPRVCVSVFPRANFAWDAVSSTHALNAGQSALQVNAPPQIRAAQQVPQHPEHPLEETVREPLICGTTLVNPDRLAFYL